MSRTHPRGCVAADALAFTVAWLLCAAVAAGCAAEVDEQTVASDALVACGVEMFACNGGSADGQLVWNSCITNTCNNPAVSDKSPAYWGCCGTGLNGPLADCLDSLTGTPGKSCAAAYAYSRQVSNLCRGAGGDPNECIAKVFREAIDRLRTEVRQESADQLCRLFDCGTDPVVGYQSRFTEFRQDPRCPIPEVAPSYGRRVHETLDANNQLGPRNTLYVNVAQFAAADGLASGVVQPIACSDDMVPIDGNPDNPVDSGWQDCDDARFQYRIAYSPRCSVQIARENAGQPTTFVGACVATAAGTPQATNANYTGAPADLMANAQFQVRQRHDNHSGWVTIDLAGSDPWAFNLLRSQTSSGSPVQTMTIEETVQYSRFFYSRPGTPLAVRSEVRAALRAECAAQGAARWPQAI